jgi:4-carboxymuconolactone decarboxylase
MQSNSPRMPLLALDKFTDEQAELAGGRGSARSQLHVVRTLVQHPALYRSWMPYAMHLIMANTLTARDREIVILHTCAVCEGDYDLAHHHVIARRAGLTDAEIEAAKSNGAGLAASELTLMKAVEELVSSRNMSDATWVTLSERYTREQLLDLIFTVGNYVTMTMLTRTCGVPIEADTEGGWKPG